MTNISALNQSDLPAIKELLTVSCLPTDDLNSAPILFFGIIEHKELKAVGALEEYQTNALLRSVAVREKFRNHGLGKQVTLFLEEKAREKDIKKLFLLTTTAADFFKKMAYSTTDRDKCPESIQRSAEFSNLCPASAACLSKRI